MDQPLMETRIALLEERQQQDRRRMDNFERQSERDIEKLSGFIKETELRIMQFVQNEFIDIEKSLGDVVTTAKELQSEQIKLAEENKEQKNQAKISEAQTATAIFFIAALVTLGELVLRFII